MEETVLSIIIPLYNVEKYIAKCLDSFINQSLENCEIIVIDDGSTDNSSKIVDEYVLHYPNSIKKIKKNNGGLSSARNFGLKYASGKYIAFVDSDDYVSSNFISNIKKEIVHQPDLIRFNLTSVNDGVEKNEQEPKFDNIDEIQFHILTDEIGNQACKNVYKVEIISNVPFKENVVFEDLYWTYKIFYKSKSIRFIDSTMYYYLMRKDSITHSTKKKQIASDTFYAFLERLEYAKNNNIDKAIEPLSKKACYHAFSNLKYSNKNTNVYKESKDFIKLNKQYVKWTFKNILTYYFNFITKLFL